VDLARIAEPLLIKPNQSCDLEPLPRFFLVLGSTLLVFIAALQVIVSIGFALGVSMAWFDVPLSVIVALIATVWSLQLFFPAQRGIYRSVAVGTLLIIGLSLVISGAFYDVSVDGRAYHTLAVITLARGWNVIRDPKLTAGTMATPAIMAQYVNFYVKGPWIEGAVIYNLTENLQVSRAFNFVWLAIAFCLAYPVFSMRLRTVRALFFALLVALNPVTIYQLFSLEVDGQFACTLASAICLWVLFVCQRHRLVMFWLAATTLIIINTKLTGLLYILIISGGISLWYALKHRSKRTELALWLIGGASAGVFLVGYNPFVTQYMAETIATGNPFYPTTYMGLTRVEENAPAAFKGQDSLTRVIRSLFSRSENDVKMPVVYKVPFALSQSELVAFGFPDTRVAGFGPFFGGVIMLIILTLVISMKRILYLWQNIETIAIIIMSLFISVCVNPAAWWARYVPQMWLLPLLGTFIFALVARTRFQRVLVWLLLVAILFNVVTVFTASVVQQRSASDLTTWQLSQIKQSNDRGLTIPVTFDVFLADQILFDSMHIQYSVVDQLPCPKGEQRTLYRSSTQYCLR